MNKPAFLMGGIFFLLSAGIDGIMLLNGLTALSIFSFIGTLFVFSSAMVWLIYKDDGKLYFRRPLLAIPIAVFGGALVVAFQKVSIFFQRTDENLPEVGNLLLSRYQVGVWAVSALIFLAFVLASSLMGRKRA